MARQQLTRDRMVASPNPTPGGQNSLSVAAAERRLPPPWSIDELEACFVVRDHSGQALAYVYFEEEPGRRCVRKTLSKSISEN